LYPENPKISVNGSRLTVSNRTMAIRTIVKDHFIIFYYYALIFFSKIPYTY